MSRSTHSSSEYLGLSNQYLRLKPMLSASRQGKYNFMPPLKDSIGETSSNNSASPSVMNHLKDSSWTSMREGRVRTSLMRAYDFRPRVSAMLRSSPGLQEAR